MTTGDIGGKCPLTFCQDGVRDFFKIDEKIGGECVVANFLRSRGRGQWIFVYAFPIIIALATPLERGERPLQ